MKEPLQTGIKAIDAMIPIGRGQRELIIGDRGTGKTAICVDTIINQKGQDVICVYVAIGQKALDRAPGGGDAAQRRRDGLHDHRHRARLRGRADQVHGARTPGCAMAEHFLYNGKHALLMYDDLTKHADAYRQMSLLVRRPPGREAYPGDVFYLHSRLLERAVKLNDELGGGLADGAAGDRDAGRRRVGLHPDQRHLDHRRPDLPASRTCSTRACGPAIDAGISVSRVGGNAQIKAMRKVAGRLRLELASYRALEAFAQFASELDAATQQQLRRGQRLVATLNQPQYSPWPVEEQVAAIWAATNGYLDQIEVADVPRFHAELVEYLRAEGTVLKAIRESGDLSDETGRGAEGRPSRSPRASSRGRGRSGGRRRLDGHPAGHPRRIRPSTTRKKITKAMELVAGSRLRRAQARIEALRPYADGCSS